MREVSLTVQELRESGRDKIIRSALEKMKQARPDLMVEDIANVKVLASERTIQVTVGMGFTAEGKKGDRTYRSYDHEVIFTDHRMDCYPLEPPQGNELDEEDKEKIDFINSSGKTPLFKWGMKASSFTIWQ